MAGHLLLAVFSLTVYFNAAYSAITADQMLAVIAQFSEDFSHPRTDEAGCVHGFCRPVASCLTEEQCPDQLPRIYT